MKKYDHKKIESKWQKIWKKTDLFKVSIDKNKKKYYVLDMFPYPSGAGLHVGHPLGYVASDIFARYKISKGFNVLHPMGFDSFGLPAEQYAIQTGAHPAITTAKNIETYEAQLKKLGFNYDWSREVQTSDPNYYKWTQWIFMKFFQSWYDKKEDKARPISELETILSNEGNKDILAHGDENIPIISKATWNNMEKTQKYKFLLKYRLAYLSDISVNWCPELGTVLANEEVKNGVSERGGYPVIKKKMKQWCLRITAYADRLLEDLDLIDWSSSIKETQKNWIGKSQGIELDFEIENSEDKLKVYTTRPDTIFGVSYLALAPEHPILDTFNLSDEIKEYISKAINKSELDRNKEIDNINGIYTGYNVLHPLTKALIPIWIADYVLHGYGTGAVMAVPAHDSRDYDFAKHFNLPFINVVDQGDLTEGAYEEKKGKIINSDFLNSLSVEEAISVAISEFTNKGIGISKTNYKLRDAIFSRQRYWGEPFPVYYDKNLPYLLDEKELPLKLPEVSKYKPNSAGDPPLANAKNWKTEDNKSLELNTMPGWAGSSWYFLRYMDSKNDNEFVSKEKQQYWQDVDFYIGGSEHATGHLLYSRFWTKFLYDINEINIKEPFRKLINQGMIQGISKFVYRIKNTNKFVSYDLRKNYETTKLHVDVNMVKNEKLDIEAFKRWREEYKTAEFILENEQYICGSEIEKMSKSKYNTVNPVDIIEKYGADSLRLYSMFLGPIEHSKPWNIDGIEGVYRFLIKLWKFFYDENGNCLINEEKPNIDSLKAINKLIKKVEEDIERFSLNTCVSSFMICLNELGSQNCNNKEVFKNFLICLSPFAPHITEELWASLGFKDSIYKQHFPKYDFNYLIEETIEYPISINGKTKTKISISSNLEQPDIESLVKQNSKVKEMLKNAEIKKIIFVKNKIINIVV